MAFGSLDNDVEWLETLNEKFPDPDITFFLKVSPKECMRRINGSRPSKELFEQEQKLKKVYKTYLKLVKNKKYKHVYVIDGERTPGGVAADIAKIIDKYLYT